MAIDRNENFSVEGFRIQRNNPDGSLPTYDNMLGFSGTIDVSSLTGSETITLKEDQSAAVTETIDITGGTYADPTAATIAEVFAELNTQIALGSLNLTASEDATAARLKLAVTTGTPDKVQLYGSLISFLGFGEQPNDTGATGTLTGIGLKILKAFDSTKTISLPKNLRDSEEIENETGDGTLTSINVPAVVKGVNPVLTTAKNDLELMQMIMGGVYDSTANTYAPPTIDDQAISPIFNIEIFTPAYEKGSNLRPNIASWEQYNLPNCIGYEADISKEAKTFEDKVFNIFATEYLDGATRKAAWNIENLTVAEYEAKDVENT